MKIQLKPANMLKIYVFTFKYNNATLSNLNTKKKNENKKSLRKGFLTVNCAIYFSKILLWSILLLIKCVESFFRLNLVMSDFRHRRYLLLGRRCDLRYRRKRRIEKRINQK